MFQNYREKKELDKNGVWVKSVVIFMQRLRSILSLSILLTFLVSFSALGRIDDARIRSLVLRKAIKDSLFVFDLSKPNDHNETQLKYLGYITTKKGGIYKIMTYCWIWGPSRRATNRILVYNSKNRYLGNYKLTMKDELPKKITSNQLVFEFREYPKSKPIETRVSLADGLPKILYMNSGDEYPFDNE